MRVEGRRGRSLNGDIFPLHSGGKFSFERLFSRRSYTLSYSALRVGARQRNRLNPSCLPDGRSVRRMAVYTVKRVILKSNYPRQ